jgi:putative protease
LKKLKTSILYGADAVYCGGQKFGLRAAADNLTMKELAEGVEFAHSHGSQVYVVLNSFLFDQDLEELPQFVVEIEKLGVDAVIVSDLGVVKTVASQTNIPIHLSTQASALNVQSGLFWKAQGVKRLIVGRELSIKECSEIKKATGLEVEMFIHGSMCMAYSGHCTISNYTQGRDSNRGGCAHSCRFEYSIDFNDKEKLKAYFMSSKDLNGLRLLEEYAKGEIDSVKIEGRMKSSLYAGTISKVYREAIDYYTEHGNLLSEKLLEWESEMNKFSHRAYTDASLSEPAGEESIFNERETVDGQSYVSAAEVIDVLDNAMVVKVTKAFRPGDKLELIPFQGKAQSFQINGILDLQNNLVAKTKPSTLVKLPFIAGANRRVIIRKQNEANNVL